MIRSGLHGDGFGVPVIFVAEHSAVAAVIYMKAVMADMLSSNSYEPV